MAAKQNPELRAAELTLQQNKTGVGVARAAYLPSLSFDYFFGINANQFAARPYGIQRLGSSAQATLNIPVWNWGSTRSKVHQAELQSALLAQESMRLTLLRYQSGEASVLEVVDAQTTLMQARNALDDGLTRYRLARANLQTLTGVL